MASTIDATTKVNLGILGTLVVMAATGAFYFGGLKASVASVDQSLKEMKIALDRNSSAIASSATSAAVRDAVIEALERRIRELERDK